MIFLKAVIYSNTHGMHEFENLQSNRFKMANNISVQLGFSPGRTNGCGPLSILAHGKNCFKLSSSVACWWLFYPSRMHSQLQKFTNSESYFLSKQLNQETICVRQELNRDSMVYRILYSIPTLHQISSMLNYSPEKWNTETVNICG